VDLTDFDYHLPPGAIADTPAEPRDAARLLVIDRARATLADHRCVDLPALLRAGDLVVVNDSRVIPARLLAVDPGRRRPVELLFIEPVESQRWRTLIRPGRRTTAGTTLVVGGEIGPRVRVIAVEPDGTRMVESLDLPVSELLETHGLTPLPPYIRRHQKPDAEDRERYQTVYARVPGSVAAPTAGLHLSTTLLDQLRGRGVEIHALTLHVGPATFQPLRVARVEDHVVPPERVTIPDAVAHAVNAARTTGRRIVAVGTTTTRALEGAAADDGRVRAMDGRVGLFIRPGHRFRVVDALLTNFHLPRSSLLVLVSAFAGRELVLRAYRHAIEAGYRFYSYGDATLIE
jgi:S-adenosylmethionine:tRNA ribosyltransferase-isomerase